MYVLIMPDKEIVWAKEDRFLRIYADMLKIKNPLIYDVTEEKMKELWQEQGAIEEVTNVIDGKDIYMTDSDFEVLSDLIGEDYEEAVQSMKEVDYFMKNFKCPEAKAVRDALRPFIKSKYTKTNNMMDRLFKHLKFKSYARKSLRRMCRGKSDLSDQ